MASILSIVTLVLVLWSGTYGQQKGPGDRLIQRIEDIKEFKKLLRTKTNVLVFFSLNSEDHWSVRKVMPICAVAAEKAYGKGTVAFVNCGSDDGKKFCKKLKIAPEPIALKHYHNGEFHKDYDRQMTGESMTKFLLDPTGDMPWSEDPAATDVVHVDTSNAWNKLLKKQASAPDHPPILAMFYAPWCGFCKRMKPDYAGAATELKGVKILAAVDVTQTENNPLNAQYNITGYPTILYFEKGRKKYTFGGENNKDGIIKWMNEPGPPKEKEPEKQWSDEPGDVAHLKDGDFHQFMKEHSSVLVMFYAPWCGHCKAMKPDYSEAAAKLKAAGSKGVLAAVDATVEKKLGEEFGVKGFPSIKYFKDGAYAWDFNAREQEKILEFMEDPQEPPPPPEPEVPWPEQETQVLHLTNENFKVELKRKKHALVMFYAPWCGHCKAAKPSFNEAAAHFKDEPKIAFAAVDCTVEKDVCSQYDVKGFPTLIYLSYFKNPTPYSGGRTTQSFIDYMGSFTDKGAPPAAKPVEEKDFESTLSGMKGRTIVMFYAPWCPHCKTAKPEFSKAAAAGKILVAVDCSQNSDLCQSEGVKGYPTFHLYEDGKKSGDFTGNRNSAGFLAALEIPPPAPTEKAKEATKSEKKTEL